MLAFLYLELSIDTRILLFRQGCKFIRGDVRVHPDILNMVGGTGNAERKGTEAQEPTLVYR